MSFSRRVFILIAQISLCTCTALFSLWYCTSTSVDSVLTRKQHVKDPTSKIVQGALRREDKSLDDAVLSRLRNTSGLACKMPDLKPFDKSISHIIKRPNETVCNGQRLTYIREGKVFFNHSSVGDVDYKWCSLVAPVRETDDYSSESEPALHRFHGNTSQLEEDVELEMNVSGDFSMVKCSEKELEEESYDSEIHDDYGIDYHYVPGMKDEEAEEHTDTFAHIFQNPRATSRAKPPQRKGGLGLNVMMFGVDSTSHMNFIRCMPKSLKYMTETLHSVTLNGYNIVGDATTGALIPMLTGKTEMELPEVRRKQENSRTVDVYPLVWKGYKRAGYVTLLAEDRPDLGAFNLRLNGFRYQPTDHYMRTFWKAADDYRKRLCLGPDLVHNVILNYFREFMTSYHERLKFGLVFLTDLTHADMNRLCLLDDDLLSFLKSIKKSGVLNQTLLIIFGDHGARYTKIRQTIQGKFEERLPFMSFTLPPWFKRAHPQAFRHLKTNADRLTTPFDIHATLESVLNFTTKEARVQDRGISLLESEIPKDRECGHAGIADHWCSCLTWEVVEHKADRWAQEVTAFLTATINNMTHNHRQNCTELRLSKVISSYRMVPNDKLVKFVKMYDPDARLAKFDDEASAPDHYNLTMTYQVTIATEPGRGQYEATVRVCQKMGGRRGLEFELSGEISRINLYGHDANCIVDVNPSLAKFCYCKKTGKKQREGI